MINHLATCLNAPDEVSKEAHRIKKSRGTPTRKRTVTVTQSSSRHLAIPPPIFLASDLASTSMLPPPSPSLPFSHLLNPSTPIPSIPSSPSSTHASLAPSDSISIAGSARSRNSHHRQLSQSASAPTFTSGGDIMLIQPWDDNHKEHYKYLLGAITSTASVPLRWIDNRQSIL
ncbi:hypothetical protein E1B28_008060 [Marasmius oreades]|uniref:Uncharacterized protein n=1 Tax=Marasmius oreades TaxID=181124 RepID=A0A9P7S2U6_9AGAR|nr:uncharacterized protein E1B28_008060 [Marasmius oreades]KAG7094464.1 hypothetical protein E1B28_008060 [Marasmius oreades]